MHLPARQIGIGAMSLVIQDGPERMELDRCLHHPPARDRLGVAPAQPRNLIRLPNCALLGSSAAPLRAAARKDSAPARKTGEEQDRDRLAYPVMEGKTIMNLGTGFSRRHPRSVILIRVLVERSMFTRFVASSIAATDQVQRSGLRVMSRRSGMWHDYQANDWRLVMTTEMSAGSGTPEHQSSAGTQSRESS